MNFYLSLRAPEMFLTCSGLGGHIIVLVDRLGGLIRRLPDHRCDRGGVDIGEDAASHPL